MELKYSFNKNDNDYIILMNDIVGLRVQALDRNIPDDIRKEILDMHLEFSMHLKLSMFHKIAIRRDSKFGSWIIENTDEKTIINVDNYISFDKVCSALLTALYESEDKVSNKIWNLFKARISGTKKDLASKYDEHILDYILKHPKFYEYSDETVEKEISNADNYISFTKTKNALLVALDESEDKISNKIWFLLKERASGTKEDLMPKYDEQVLDYILKHPNFDEYSDEIDDNQKGDEEYIIYEDNCCKLSSIPKATMGKVKVKVDKKEC